jgi:hypothetical protein
MSTIRQNNVKFLYEIFLILFQRGILNIYRTSSSNVYIIAQNEIIARNIFNTANLIPYNIVENSYFSELYDQIIGNILKFNIKLDILLDGYIIELNEFNSHISVNLENIENIFERIVTL